MAVMSWLKVQTPSMENLVDKLHRIYPNLTFVQGNSFYWSPRNNHVFYIASNKPRAVWSLLHETAHAVLHHTLYAADFELLALEVAAWEEAKRLSQRHGLKEPDKDYIQDCLDSYREWLHARSICPCCGTETMQYDQSSTYVCFNCRHTWTVTPSRFCRAYRMDEGNRKSPASWVAGDSLC